MRRNKSARKAATRILGDDVDIAAILLISPALDAAKTVGFGTGKPQSGVYATDYAAAHDIEPANARDDLHPGWMTLATSETADELVFHLPGMRGLRPGPVEVIDRMPRDGVRLAWFDRPGRGLTARVLHLRFVDGSQLLTATAYASPGRNKPFDAEPDLFVEAFRPDAEHITAG